MDFALWDPSDVQDENNYYIDDYWHSDFYFGYWHDAIEEDVLNEKSCIQVLRILLNKVDEEIMELEEDVVIHQSKLTWGDKDWPDLCSATLKEKIDHLDISVLTLKKEISGDEHIFGVELLKNKKTAESLHHILRPLWDNCFLLEKSQNEQSISIIRRSCQPLLTSCSKHRKLKAKKGFARMKNNECHGPSEDLEVKMMKHPKAKSIAKKLSTRNSEEKASSTFKLDGCCIEVPEKIIRPLPAQPAFKADLETRDKEGDAVSSIMNAHTYATEKNTNQLNGQAETQKLSSTPDKVRKRTNPSKAEKLQNALVKDSSASSCKEKASSKGRKKKRNINIEFIQHSFTDKSEVFNSSLDSPGMGTKFVETVKPAETFLDSQLDAKKLITEDFSRILKARRQEVADTVT